LREVVLSPGAKIRVHGHNQRPAIAYVLEGELVDHRSDSEHPLVRQQGDSYFEGPGVVHWVENVSNHRVRVISVDIVPTNAQWPSLSGASSRVQMHASVNAWSPQTGLNHFPQPRHMALDKDWRPQSRWSAVRGPDSWSALLFSTVRASFVHSEWWHLLAPPSVPLLHISL
jgi:hypothetical protein